MSSILPPATDTQVHAAPTCHEFLGIARGFCPRPAHIKDDQGFGFCWPHAGERGIHA